MYGTFTDAGHLLLNDRMCVMSSQRPNPIPLPLPVSMKSSIGRHRMATFHPINSGCSIYIQGSNNRLFKADGFSRFFLKLIRRDFERYKLHSKLGK